MLKIIIFTSLYLSNLRIEGDFLLQDRVKQDFIKTFLHGRYSLFQITDSLFKIYENTGFFNVELNVEVDTISVDTITMVIHVKSKRIPVIYRTRMQGVGFYDALKKLYFPYAYGNRVFIRKRLLRSLKILENLSLIKDGKYYFYKRKKGNESYILVLKLVPANEIINFIINGQANGVSGNIAFSQKSILSSGMSLGISASFSNDSLYFYDLNLHILSPVAKGLDIFGSFSYLQTPEHIYWKSIGLKRAKEHQIYGLSFIKRGDIQNVGFNLAMMYKKMSSSIFLQTGKLGMSVLLFTAFSEERFYFSLAQALFSHEGNILFSYKKPLRDQIMSIQNTSIFPVFVFRTRIDILRDRGIFYDLSVFNQKYQHDIGFFYLKNHLGLYLSGSVEDKKMKLLLGLVIGKMNSLFECPVSIL